MYKVDRKCGAFVRTLIVEADNEQEALEEATLRWPYLAPFKVEEFRAIGHFYESIESLSPDH